MYHTFDKGLRFPVIGTILFIGFFILLLWQLKDLANAILSLLQATH